MANLAPEIAARITRTGALAYRNVFCSIGTYEVDRYERPIAVVAMPRITLFSRVAGESGVKVSFRPSIDNPIAWIRTGNGRFIVEKISCDWEDI
jgi:hypothetical protein